MVMITAIGALLMSRTLLDQKRINERRRDLWRAYHHAEAGVAQVQQWGAYHDTFLPDTTLFDEQRPPNPTNAELLLLEDESRYPVFAAMGSSGIVVTESELDAMGIDGFVTESGWSVGRITELALLPIDDVQSPAESHLTAAQYTDSLLVSTNPDDSNYAFFKVLCRGVSSSGLERELRAYMKPTPVALIALPAPVISLATASAFGNAKIHWGEAWSKTNFSVLNRSQLTYALSDPLAIWRTEGLFEFPSNWSTSATYQANKLYDSGISGSNPFTLPSVERPGLYPDGTGDWKDTLYQNIPSGTLDFPDFLSQYETFKKIAKANNRYYTTDSSGNIYHNGTIVDFYQAFSPNDPDTPFELAFVDTLNQQPPDGTNLATIHISGDNDVGDRIRGFYYFAANFRVGGVGSPASLTVENPLTGTDTTLAKMWLDGVIYTAGTMDMDGNAGVYGSIVAEQGFIGGGTPDVYYNSDLADGLELSNGNLGGPFQVVISDNYSPGN